jgi:hypothetical protein
MKVNGLLVGLIAVAVMSFAYDAKAITTTTAPADPTICSPCAIPSIHLFQALELEDDFAHVYDFTLDAAANLNFDLTNQTSGGTNNDNLQLFVYYSADLTSDPTGGTVTFGDPNTAPATGLVGSTAEVGTGGGNPFESLFLGNMLPGNYWALVVGQPNTTGGYTGTLSVSAVPLPPAIWLFISALVGLVSFARIRRNGTLA